MLLYLIVPISVAILYFILNRRRANPSSQEDQLILEEDLRLVRNEKLLLQANLKILALVWVGIWIITIPLICIFWEPHSDPAGKAMMSGLLIVAVCALGLIATLIQTIRYFSKTRNFVGVFCLMVLATMMGISEFFVAIGVLSHIDR